MKINCLIIDDEAPARLLLENYVGRLSHLHLVAQCSNPLEALPHLQKGGIDMLFLDIQMPELTGIDFLKTMPIEAHIIITTAYKQYALQGYELNVVDYLLKPFRFERFLQAVGKVSKIMAAQTSSAETLLPALKATTTKENYLLIKSEYKIFRISHEEILYIESMKEYVAFHLQDKRILSLGSLKKLQEELPQDSFIRIHKSFIVSKRKVAALEGNRVHVGAKKLPIGASYRAVVLAELFDQK